MSTCQYIEWNAETRKLEPCGEPAESVLVKKRRHDLCEKHAEFALDAVNDYEVKLYKLTAKQEKERAKEAKRKK